MAQRIAAAPQIDFSHSGRTAQIEWRGAGVVWQKFLDVDRSLRRGALGYGRRLMLGGRLRRLFRLILEILDFARFARLCQDDAGPPLGFLNDAGRSRGERQREDHQQYQMQNRRTNPSRKGNEETAALRMVMKRIDFWRR